MAWLLMETFGGGEVGVNTADVRSVFRGAWVPCEPDDPEATPPRQSRTGDRFFRKHDLNATLVTSKSPHNDSFNTPRSVTIAAPIETVLAQFNLAEANQLALALVIKETPA